MNPKSSIPLIILALFVGILMNISPGCSPEAADIESVAESTPLPTRNIRSSSLELTEVWRVRTGRSSFSSIASPPLLFATDDKIVVPSLCKLRNNDIGCLTALSLDSGEVIWESTYKDPSFGVSITSSYLDTNTNRLYLIYSGSVAAFDLQTGKQIWLSEILASRASSEFSYNQNLNQVSVDREKELLLLDPSNGKVIAREKRPFSAMMVLYHKDMVIYNHKNGLSGINQTSQSMWTWEGADYALLWPFFIDDNDLIAWFGGATFYLARINYHTGETVWVSPRIIMSNYAIHENRVFVLRYDDLAMMDLEDGSVLGRIWFDKMLYEGGARTNSFMVMVSYPYLFTYFGDTQELVAFKFETK